MMGKYEMASMKRKELGDQLKELLDEGNWASVEQAKCIWDPLSDEEKKQFVEELMRNPEQYEWMKTKEGWERWFWWYEQSGGNVLKLIPVNNRLAIKELVIRSEIIIWLKSKGIVTKEDGEERENDLKAIWRARLCWGIWSEEEGPILEDILEKKKEQCIGFVDATEEWELVKWDVRKNPSWYVYQKKTLEALRLDPNDWNWKGLMNREQVRFMVLRSAIERENRWSEVGALVWREGIESYKKGDSGQEYYMIRWALSERIKKDVTNIRGESQDLRVWFVKMLIEWAKEGIADWIHTVCVVIDEQEAKGVEDALIPVIKMELINFFKENRKTGRRLMLDEKRGFEWIARRLGAWGRMDPRQLKDASWMKEAIWNWDRSRVEKFVQEYVPRVMENYSVEMRKQWYDWMDCLEKDNDVKLTDCMHPIMIVNAYEHDRSKGIQSGIVACFEDRELWERIGVEWTEDQLRAWQKARWDQWWIRYNGGRIEGQAKQLIEKINTESVIKFEQGWPHEVERQMITSPWLREWRRTKIEEMELSQASERKSNSTIHSIKRL